MSPAKYYFNLWIEVASDACLARREHSPMQLSSQTRIPSYQLKVVTMLAFSLLLLAGDVARAVGGGLSLLCVLHLHVPATRHQHLRLSLCCLTITSYCFCQNTKDVHALLCLEQRDRLASCGSLWYRYTTKVIKRPELNWICVSFQSRNEWHRTKALDLFALFCLLILISSLETRSCLIPT